jgi:hypothetical protein
MKNKNYFPPGKGATQRNIFCGCEKIDTTQSTIPTISKCAALWQEALSHYYARIPTMHFQKAFISERLPYA